MSLPTADAPVPCATAHQMRKVDRWTVEQYGLTRLQLTENTGRHLAHLARTHFLGGRAAGQKVLVLCGDNRNGAGGLVAARRLHGWGVSVRVGTTKPPGAYQASTMRLLRTLQVLEVPVAPADPEALPGADLIVDALLGARTDHAALDDAEALIQRSVWHDAPVLSLDVPSGLDATTGVPTDTTAYADATLALGLPACGLDAPAARSSVGALYLADIGVPPAAYAALDDAKDVSGLFARHDLVRLRDPS